MIFGVNEACKAIEQFHKENKIGKAMNKEQIEPAQLEKAPEPHSYWTEWAGHEDAFMGEHVFELPEDIEGFDNIVPLYTSPPEVAELQPEIERLVALNDKLRANEQKLIDDKFELQRQVQALQAENQELQNVADLARFLANTWEAIDKFVYANIDVDAMDKYPVIQGTSNQINLAKIGAQKYTNANLYAAIAYLLKDKSC